MQKRILTTVLVVMIALPNFVMADELEGMLDFTQPAIEGVSPVFLNPPSESEEMQEGMINLFNNSPLAPSRSSFDVQQRMTFALVENGNDVGAVESINPEDGRKHPGRAVLLSALVPGTGQFYAESPLKGALFLGLEVACWVGAVYYANEGQDKEEEFEGFADDLWDENLYQYWEWYNARTYHDDPEDHYNGSLTEWNNLTWNEKLDYLPTFFTHDLPESKTQQYYEMIGKYLMQFGIAWYHEDAPEWDDQNNWDGLMEIYDPERWTTEDISTINHFTANYIDMRYDHNQLLDRSGNLFMVIMVNHVVAALDAGFTVTRHNRRLVEGELGARLINYNDESIIAAGVNFTF